MSEHPPAKGMQRFTVTYCQEVVQMVDAPNIESAGRFAQNAAANVKGARVLSVYAGALPALPAPSA
jgi:hypothetical protein